VVDEDDDDEDEDDSIRALISPISFLISDSNHSIDFSSSCTNFFIVLNRHKLSWRFPKAR